MAVVVGIGVVAQERGDGHDEARACRSRTAGRGSRGTPACTSVSSSPSDEALDRGDLAAVGLHREHQAGPDGCAVEQHGARAADAVLAPEVGAGEAAPLAQEVGEGQAGLDGGAPRLAVHPDLDRELTHGGPPRRRWSTPAPRPSRTRGAGRRTSRAGRTAASPASAAASRPTSAASRSSTAAPIAAASADDARTGVDAMPMRADRAAHDARRRSSASCTATAAPAMAKSPCRRANSSTAKPHRPDQIGNDTPTSSSSGSRAVDQRPVKKSARRDRAATARARGPRSRRRAPSATAGYSAAGSAWAIEPPTVPAVADLEVPDERRRLGDERRRRRHVGAVLDLGVGRARADPAARRSAARCPRRPSMRPMSTRRSNTARRRASMGMRLCPPASTLASSPCSASSADRLVGRGRGVVVERCRLHVRFLTSTSRPRAASPHN